MARMGRISAFNREFVQVDWLSVVEQFAGFNDVPLKSVLSHYCNRCATVIGHESHERHSPLQDTKVELG